MFQLFFEALERTSPAVAIKQSTWVMPLANTIHALGMTILIGSIIILSLRLLGVAMPQLAEVWPWTIAGLVIMLASGLFLFVPESTRWYGSTPFRVKMSFLFVAVLFHFTVFRRMVRAEHPKSRLRQGIGALALILWFGVGWGGRAITFLE